MPRLTPFELVFGEEGRLADELFPPIRAEAEQRGGADSPADFLLLSTVGALVRRLSGEEGGEALEQHGRLLYHGYHHWRGGRRLLTLDEATARALIEDDVPPAGALRPPHGVGYLQLPRNLFWARADEALPPEPVDGLFWVARGEDGVERLDLLLVLGLRPDRPGFSVVAASARADAPDPGWARADARPGGRDFESTLPGGELGALYSIETRAEALKLAARALRHLES